LTERETQTARRRWLDPGWLAQVASWVGDRLADEHLSVTGPFEQPHIRPWSTAISVPTTGGRIWFKAGGPGNRYEAALLQLLSVWEVRGVLRPLAIDVDRAWILLPDGGERLRDGLHGGPGLEAWARILPEWAALQRSLAPRADELVAAGVPDLRPDVIPGRLETMLDDRGLVMADAERRRLRGLLPAIASLSADLNAAGIPASLQHDDLHDGNVFVGEAGDRFFDWGDASVAHPFGTLLVTLRSIADRGLGDAAATRRALDHLRDAYLEAWTGEHSRAELAAVVPIAMRLAIIGRAFSWHRALTGIPLDDQGEWAGAPAAWLMDLFEAELV
jgi:hypothetical protein